MVGNKTYEKELEIYENRLNQAKQDLKQAKEQIDKPFEYDERLNYLLKRKIEIDYNIQMGATKEENKSTISNEIHKRIYVKEEKEKNDYNSIKGELSKDAKKELYLKNRDKGYER